MYNDYYYNKNTDKNGNHEVHKDSCSYLPKSQNRVYIGYKNDCSSAIQKAKNDTGKSNFDGCYHCSNSCHKG
ncbi:hypothetical protein D8M05_15665 [Oceanobacillus bengalensis]|uniref:Uncharacterized protein n=1 Tax=Oceanobacillus bengalensis TaxID=1435466 RepID=A0A494YTR3_9BACI|nr:hypothetical protein D8M05_15665 [Oceanobacillus bengalensis]